VTFPSDDGQVKAVDGVTFDLYPNEVLGHRRGVGLRQERDLARRARLAHPRAHVTGEILYRGVDLVTAHDRERQRLRGSKIAMVFQDALTALNPVYTVGDQVAEAITSHRHLDRSTVRAEVRRLLDLVGIPNPDRRVDQYPHEFSGGMRQRAMIAMSLANDPDVLIADEPTTALDVTIQAQVLEVLERIQERTSSAIILITHDLGVVAGMADRVMVMYAGRQAEVASVTRSSTRPAPLHSRAPRLAAPYRPREPQRPPLSHQGSAAVAPSGAVWLCVPSEVRLRPSPGTLCHGAPSTSRCDGHGARGRVPLRRGARRHIR
jgi:ABC-type dipeptide/oligopeptide/nickel transport system ATPase component